MDSADYQPCPLCHKLFTVQEIEQHANKCIFLNSSSSSSLKRKSSSPPQHSKKRRSLSPAQKPSLRQEGSTSFDFKVSLTQQLQPQRLNDIIGQESILNQDAFLGSLLCRTEVLSVIFWGPPGCGKSSLANVICEMCQEKLQYHFLTLDATDVRLKDLQDALSENKKKTVMLIEEIHRLTKRQQKLVAGCVARGDGVVIGTTTENPSFCICSYLLNKCKVVVMDKLDNLSLMKILEKALQYLNVGILDDLNTIRNMFQGKRTCIHHSALKYLADSSDGDARIALNNLQLVLQHCGHERIVSIKATRSQIQKSHMLYDRDGEEHHNIISAMHESIKFYNENGALYWTTRMLLSGEDPLFIARRLIRAASEDTGNADPQALKLAVATMQGCQVLGKPDCDVLLAQCAIYLARAPYNKQSHTALSMAKKIIQDDKHQPAVPVPLTDISLKLLRELGYDKKNSFMPAGLENVKFL